MADQNLNTSIAALAQDLITMIPTATPEELVLITRAAKLIQHTENTGIETALNNRINALMSGTVHAEDMQSFAVSIKNMMEDIVSSTAVDLSDLQQDLLPLNNNSASVGSALKRFLDVYASNINTISGTITNTPSASTDIVNKQYVDDSLANFNVSGDFLPSSTNTYDIGSPTDKWVNVYTSAVKGLSTPVDGTDATTKTYVDNLFASASSPVTSVNGYLGSVQLNTDDIDEGLFNLWYTEQRISDYLNTNSYATTSYVDSAVAAGGGSGGGGASVSTTSTPPPDAADGDLWYNSEDGSLYVYFSDPDSSQWVQVVNPFGVPGLFELDNIVDGTNLQVLTTDGAGNVSFQDVPRDVNELTDADSLLYTNSDLDTYLSTIGTGIIKTTGIELLDNGSTVSEIKIDQFGVLTIDSLLSNTIFNSSGTFTFNVNNNPVFTVNPSGSAIASSLYFNSLATNVFMSVEGSNQDSHQTNFEITEPTADRNITFKDQSGTVAYLTDLPVSILDLGIVDGTDEQLLQTDGNGNFTFVDRVGARVVVGATAPTGIVNLQGDMWYNTEDGSIYVYYVDADSGQWVQVVNPFGVPGLEELDDVQLDEQNLYGYHILQFDPLLGQWTNRYPSIQHNSDVRSDIGPTNNQIMRYNQIDARFEFVDLPNDELLDNLTLTSPTEHQFIQYTPTGWVNSYPSIQHMYDVRSDVNPSDDDFLKWNAPEGRWEYSSIAVEDLVNVDLGGVEPTLGQALGYNTATQNWEPRDIPAKLTDLQISDGTLNQMLLANGDGTYTFADQTGISCLFSADAPPVAGRIAGDLWYNTEDGSLYVLYVDPDSTQWVQILNPTPAFSQKHDWTTTTEVSSHILAPNEHIILDTTGGSKGVSLPTNPTFGDEIRVVDGGGNAQFDTISIFHNGHNVEGQSGQTIILNQNYGSIRMVYYNSTTGWIRLDN